MRGDRVRVLDNVSTGWKKNLASVWDRIKFIQVEVTNSGSVQSSVAGADHVINPCPEEGCSCEYLSTAIFLPMSWVEK